MDLEPGIGPLASGISHPASFITEESSHVRITFNSRNRGELRFSRLVSGRDRLGLEERGGLS